MMRRKSRLLLLPKEMGGINTQLVFLGKIGIISLHDKIGIIPQHFHAEASSEVLISIILCKLGKLCLLPQVATLPTINSFRELLPGSFLM